MKKTKGITLIALIITIIVMLILVAVTLTIALGDNGIIAKAREARTKTEKSQTAESELTETNGAQKIQNVVDGGSETFLAGGEGNNQQQTPNKLKQYIFGSDLQGRDITEIMNIFEELLNIKNRHHWKV